jgi:phosphatidylglycerol lysyltransferase
VARQGGRISGFVNLLMPDEREEFTADLMRYRTDAMKGVMEFLFAHAMLLGKEEGYRHFSLGMAPFSGLDTRPLAPLRTRLGGGAPQGRRPRRTRFRRGGDFREERSP